jgi:putative heme transporter
MPPISSNSATPSKTSTLQRMGFSMLIITILVYWMYVLQGVIVPFAMAIVVSMLLYPLSSRLERWGLPCTLSILLAILLAILVVVGFMTIISMQVANFSDMMPNMIKKLEVTLVKVQDWASDHFHIDKARQQSEFRKYSQNLLKDSGTMMGSALSTTTNTLGNATLIPLYAFFLLYYRSFFKTFFYKVFSTTKRTAVDAVLNKIYEAVKGYWAGVLIVTLIVGTLNSIGLLILGIEQAVFFGFLAAVLLIIPYIGILIGSLFPIVVALATKDSVMYAVGVAGLFFFIQILEGNFITPHIVGSKISINPLVAIIALLLGASLWGLAGMVLSLPITAILKVIFDSVEKLKPYGYLLGEPEETKKLAQKKRKVQEIEKDIMETISETSKGVKSLISNKKPKSSATAE